MRGHTGIGYQLWRLASWARGEIVLCVAALLAAASCVLVPPDAGYRAYIDYETLGKLFALMLVMACYQRLGVFRAIASALIARSTSARGLAAVLVGISFFASMLITNDVALVTFVPLALVALGMARADERACIIVVLMTCAANLGSMLTPMGNPQNLYLFGRSGMEMGSFLALMAPYAGASAALIAVLVWALVPGAASARVHLAGLDGPASIPLGRCALVTVLFGVCLACVAGLVPVAACVAAVAVAALAQDRGAIRAVDYGLLLTFVAFYVFVGNMGRFAPFREMLALVVEGRACLVAVAASQVISNVPAALLLAGFTGDINGLIVGANLGGLGTLIASMASLISYKQFTLTHPAARGRYLAVFTVVNVGLLLALGVLAWALGV